MLELHRSEYRSVQTAPRPYWMEKRTTTFTTTKNRPIFLLPTSYYYYLIHIFFFATTVRIWILFRHMSGLWGFFSRLFFLVSISHARAPNRSLLKQADCTDNCFQHVECIIIMYILAYCRKYVCAEENEPLYAQAIIRRYIYCIFLHVVFFLFSPPLASGELYNIIFWRTNLFSICTKFVWHIKCLGYLKQLQ